MNWRALDEELARLRNAGRTPQFWWRDDDATAPAPPLRQLLTLAEATGVPVALPVVPRAAPSGRCHAGQYARRHRRLARHARLRRRGGRARRGDEPSRPAKRRADRCADAPCSARCAGVAIPRAVIRAHAPRRRTLAGRGRAFPYGGLKAPLILWPAFAGGGSG